MASLSERWQKWTSLPSPPTLHAAEPPFRSELFSIEQLTRHAKRLAGRHLTAAGSSSNPLLDRLSENEQALKDFNRATLIVKTGRHITPAAEWLLDNFYLIEDQVLLAKRHLPSNYSRELPCLVESDSAGLPRVYDIVVELISHMDAQIDAESLAAFIAAYQTVESLKLGELWAIPIMLRLGLIENLHRITTRLIAARADRDYADAWADRLQEMAEINPSHLVVVVADMAKAGLPTTSAFVAEFAERLSRHDTVMHLARGWLEQSLHERGLSIEQLVHQENQSQAADQISVSHSIASLRSLSVQDWQEFVETLSIVEDTLRFEPVDIYRRMDFKTRDRYRHTVEIIARRCELTEAQVALNSVQLAAEKARTLGPDHREAHVGYFLIDEGRPALERAVKARRPLRACLEACIQRFPLLFYVGGVSILTLLAAFGLLQLATLLRISGGSLWFLALAFVFCASQLAVEIMNGLATLLVKPRPLPRLNFSQGISSESRSIVVVPTLLSTIEGAQRLVETLELHYLANRDPRLHFALLTDFRDAGLIQLFDPPFDKSDLEPSYIKGYIPGVRENGGQYTHGAIWAAMAFAKMGDTERAWELFRMLNPVTHGGTPERMATYKVEPYVVTADVYAMPPHVGRGGWTWYTGSAGWMYRLLVETLLGIHRKGDQLALEPCIPKEWDSFKIHYRYSQTLYHITISRLPENSPEIRQFHIDGQKLDTATLHLTHDRQEHSVELMIR